MPGYATEEMLYLSRADVLAACAQVDVCAAVEDALGQHAAGRSVLPDEAYLGWQAPDGTAARSLAMPGGLPGTGADGAGADGAGADAARADRAGAGGVLGLKVINGSLGNPARGLARAEGLVLLFDPLTARVRVLMEAAHISALRTAAVTAVTARRLAAPGLDRVAVLGCGALARAHLMLLPGVLSGLSRATLFDTDPARAESLAADLRAAGWTAATVAADARECVRDALLVVTATTTTTGYIAYDWLAPGCLVAHVSLDDVLPDVVRRAGTVLVDDWTLVSTDRRRLLGRMYAAGELRAPDGTYHPDSAPAPDAPRVTTTLPEIVAGRHPGRTDPDDVVLSNPFGMSVLDLAVAGRVHEVAVRTGAGRLLPV
jgi:ornithine cyclodeaminase